MAAGAFLFLPASTAASFRAVPFGAGDSGCGHYSLQVAANPYVANLGPPDTASTRFNLAQAFFSFWTQSVAPFFGNMMIQITTEVTQETMKLKHIWLLRYHQFGIFQAGPAFRTWGSA